MSVMRSQLVAMILEHVGDRGGPAAALADAHGIPAPCRQRQPATVDLPAVPVARVVALAEAAARALGDEWLGLHLADSVPRGVYGAQEFAIRNAPTLGEAALRLVRYQRLTNDAIVWGVEQGANHSTLTHRVPGAREALGRQLNDFSLATALRFVRELGGTAAREVRFAHRAPGDVGPLAERFGDARLTFGAAANALVFGPEQWSRPVSGADASLLPVLDSYASTLVPKEDPSTGWTARVRDHLRRHLSGTCRLEQVAEALGLSARSLQRRLDDEGASFTGLLDDLRREQARTLLAGAEASVDEISFLLGFAERRAFLRAFRRWEGCSPTAYRRREAAP